MPTFADLDEIQQRILVFVCRHIPASSPPGTQFESRQAVTGELRISLSEYDQACGALIRLGLLISDQPLSGDCDFIAPSAAGRALRKANL